MQKSPGGQDSVNNERIIQTVNSVSRMSANSKYLVGKYQIDFPICVDNTQLKESVDNVLEFTKFLAKMNIPYLYIQAPNKLSPKEKNLPQYIKNKLNDIATQFLQLLEDKEVANFDLRQCFIDNNVNFEDKFFNTDVHWTPETAFEVTPVICELVSMITKMEFDNSFFDISNYNTKTHERMFRGVYGNMCSSVDLSDLSDFTIILPKFNTDFIFSCKNINYLKEGRAEEALLLPSQFSWDMVNPKNVYCTYNLVYGDYTVIKNKLAYNDKKILILNDSFCNTIASFLSHHFSELHFLELRPNMRGVQKYTKKELFQIIDDVKPDIVIQMYFPACIAEFSSLFDINPNTKIRYLSRRYHDISHRKQ